MKTKIKQNGSIPRYLSPRNISFDLSVDLSTARQLIDEAGSHGAEVIQRQRLLRVRADQFWQWWESFRTNPTVKSASDGQIGGRQ